MWRLEKTDPAERGISCKLIVPVSSDHLLIGLMIFNDDKLGAILETLEVPVKMARHLRSAQGNIIVFQRAIRRLLFGRPERDQRGIQDHETRVRSAVLETIDQHPDLKGSVQERTDAGAVVAPPFAIDDDILIILGEMQRVAAGIIPSRQHALNGFRQIMRLALREIEIKIDAIRPLTHSNRFTTQPTNPDFERGEIVSALEISFQLPWQQQATPFQLQANYSLSSGCPTACERPISS